VRCRSAQRASDFAVGREASILLFIARKMGRSFFVDDAAALLGVSRRTVYYLIRDGKLRTIRTMCGSQRVLLESIEELLRARVPTPRAAAASDTVPSGKYPEL